MTPRPVSQAHRAAAEEPASSPDDAQLNIWSDEPPQDQLHAGPGAYDEPVARPRRSQISELPGETWEDIFVCEIDESAGLRDDL